MATMPRGATLIENAVSMAPGFTIGNVHVMAGVPRIMQSMFTWLAPQLAGGPPIVSRAGVCGGVAGGPHRRGLEGGTGPAPGARSGLLSVLPRDRQWSGAGGQRSRPGRGGGGDRRSPHAESRVWGWSRSKANRRRRREAYPTYLQPSSALTRPASESRVRRKATMGGENGSGDRGGDDAPGIQADRAVSIRDAVLQLSRPHQYRLCLAADEQAARPRSVGVRLCRQHLLLRLHGARGTQQHAAAPGGGAALDRSHPDLLGVSGGRDGVRLERQKLLRAAFPAGRHGGRLPARRCRLPHELVPRAVSRAGSGRVHHRRVVCGDPGRTGLNRDHDLYRRSVRPAGLAVDVPDGGCAPRSSSAS